MSVWGYEKRRSETLYRITLRGPGAASGIRLPIRQLPRHGARDIPCIAASCRTTGTGILCGVIRPWVVIPGNQIRFMGMIIESRFKRR